MIMDNNEMTVLETLKKYTDEECTSMRQTQREGFGETLKFFMLAL